MAEIDIPLHAELNADINSAALLSFRRVFDVLATSGDARKTAIERFPDLFSAELPCGIGDLRLDRHDLFFGEPIFLTTSGALKFTLQPSERYIEFVTAIAGDRYISCDADFHGWPVLSDSCEPRSVQQGTAQTESSFEGLIASWADPILKIRG